MSCQCYQIGGPFIAEDPDCPAHGLEAQARAAERDEIIEGLERALQIVDEEAAHGISGDDVLIDAARRALRHLQSL